MTGLGDSVPKHFLIIVPGYMGSTLRDKSSGKLVWVDFSSIPVNPLGWGDWINALLKKMAFPNDALEPAGIVNDVLFVPPWAKMEEYGRLLAALESFGYRVDPTRYPEEALDVYTFPYDWRQDNRLSGRQLAQAVERWLTYHPGAKPWIIAHSNGGLVSRWYIEKEGGKDIVGRLFLFGSPWDGTPKIMRMLFNGVDTLFRQRFNLFDIPRRSRDLIRTFPSAYQLIPHTDPFLRDENNNTLDPLGSTGWLDDEPSMAMARDGLKFSQELGSNLSVETLCFFGRQQLTTTAGTVHFEAQARWRSIDWQDTMAGDGTIPERSAVYANAAGQFPFAVTHGDIYVDPAVIQFLKWELIDKYSSIAKDISIAPPLSLRIIADRDTYQPGELINLAAMLVTPADSLSSGSSDRPKDFAATLKWLRALPGDAEPVASPIEMTLRFTLGEGDVYSVSTAAPTREGFYTVRGQVVAKGQLLTGETTLMIEAQY